MNKDNKIDIILYSIIKFILKLLAQIPRRGFTCLAEPLGRLWYRFDGYHRKIAFDNMSQAFAGEFISKQIEHMVQSNFVQLVRVMLEIPSLLRISPATLDTYVEMSGAEHLSAALARGKGVLLLSAHLGNWEMAGLALPLKTGVPMHGLARPLDFAPLDKVLNEIRTSTGNRILDKDKSARTVARLLRQNQVVGVMLDQNSSWYEGIYVPFFNRTACTNKGLAMFALRYDAAVVPIFNIRRPDGRYRVIMAPPVSMIRTSDIRSDITVNTTRFNRIIEEYIRMAPDNWLWVHRRWRIKEVPASAKERLKCEVPKA